MDSDGEEIKLTINKEYAERYQHAKKAQELSHIRDKYGDLDEEDLEKIAERQHKYGYSKKADLDYGLDEDDSEEDEEEDETGELITPELDGQIMRTIGMIRSKDPKIYEAANYFFIPEEMENARKEWKEKQEQAKKNKPVTLKDYHRKVLLEDGGLVDEEEEVKKSLKGKAAKTKKDESEMTYVEQQEHLKKEMRDAFGDDDDDDGDDADSFFTQKAKTKEDEEAEEEDYKMFLMESMGSKKSGAEAFQDWQNYKNNPKMDKDEAFLMDYILNRGWIDKSQKKTPHYKEIVREDELDELEKSEDELDAAEEWESKYNFRYEEANGDSLMGYSRTIDDSVRNKDDRRKKQRERKKQRKAEEAVRKQEELKRLKNQKMQEIFEKLKKIKEITGNDSVGFNEIDLETEFNPEDYDQKMQDMFSDKYYEADENEKPVFDDDIDIGMYEDEEGQESHHGDDEGQDAEGEGDEYAEEDEAYPGDEGEEGYDEQYEGYGEEGYGEEDYGYGYDEEEDIMMDADYMPGGENFGETNDKKKKLSKKEREMIEKEAKKMTKKGTPYKTAVEAIAASRSTLDADKGKKAFKEYLEEYYQLDYEDMVGDTPTRFKYSKVKPTAYGLTPVEILLADDKDLNEYVSLKKFAPYRRPEDEERDIQRISKKKRLQQFRHKLKSQLSKEPVDKLWDPARYRRRELEKKRQQEEQAHKASEEDEKSKSEESKKLKNKKKQDKKKEKKKLAKTDNDLGDSKSSSDSKKRKAESSDEETERKKEKKEKRKEKKEKKDSKP
ncbi:KRRI-Interacting protein 1 [Actinomortierella ambigua]|nr:KRRI-Interacting protein 1 [Actinomortierella ambigua]